MATSTSRRKMVVIVLGSVLFVLLCAFMAMNAFNNFLNPTTTEETLVFTGLSFVAFLLFVVVLVLLVRNVLKLYADQRSRVLGTRLRTRMLWGAVLVSLIPIVFMFLFSYLLMNRAVDRWFSQDPDAMRYDSNTLALELEQYTSANARAEATAIATSLPAAETALNAVPSTDRAAADGRVLLQHETTLQGGFAIVYRGGHSVAAINMPQRAAGPAQVKPWVPQSSPADEDVEPPSARAPVTVHTAGGPPPARPGSTR